MPPLSKLRVTFPRIAALLLSSSALANAQTWNAATGDWFVPGNWTPTGVPTSSTNAQINNGGTAQVSIAGAQCVALSVGYTMAGSLTIQNGGTVTSSSTTVAHAGILTIQGGSNLTDSTATLSGMATLNGSNSSWINTSAFEVGENAPGTLFIENGASVTDQYGSVGHNNLGTVTVTGAGSSWSSTASGNILVVGSTSSSNSTNSLTIENGGFVSDGAGTIGGASNGSVLVDGASSTWTNSGDQTLSYNGTASLTIQNGGAVSDANAFISTGAMGHFHHRQRSGHHLDE
jgi:T5SS/PEP-CTERM-associated repeat protein